MSSQQMTVGWIGLGNMGAPLATRLVKAGYDVHVWNRTAAKAQPLVDEGASVGETVRDLAQREVVFSMVSASKDLEQVMLDPEVGLLTGESVPRIVVDCSTVSVETSKKIREAAAERGTRFFAAPVSGNGKVVAAGKLSVVCSGDEETFQLVQPMISRWVGRSLMSVTVKPHGL